MLYEPAEGLGVISEKTVNPESLDLPKTEAWKDLFEPAPTTESQKIRFGLELRTVNIHHPTASTEPLGLNGQNITREVGSNAGILYFRQTAHGSALLDMKPSMMGGSLSVLTEDDKGNFVWSGGESTAWKVRPGDKTDGGRQRLMFWGFDADIPGTRDCVVRVKNGDQPAHYYKLESNASYKLNRFMQMEKRFEDVTVTEVSLKDPTGQIQELPKNN